MNLLVVSHTPHYRRTDGRWFGWGPTVRELDHLATRFDRLFHLAPVHPGVPPASSAAYSEANIEVIPLPPAGGARWRDKLEILAQFPGYFSALRRAIRRAQVVHVRCPANLSLLTIVALALGPSIRGGRPWWVKYAGNWRPEGSEPLSYRFQRVWLSRPWPGLVVTVNGDWADRPQHVRCFDNPCLSLQEWRKERALTQRKTLERPIRLLFVGNLDQNKGARYAVEAVGCLRSRGIAARLDLVGDGPQRQNLLDTIQRLELGEQVALHGAQPREALADWYREAHFLLAPSRTEGWPKVLAEAMARSVVPLASPISCIPQVLTAIGAGQCPDQRSGQAYAQVIESYINDPSRWQTESRRASAAAERFTYDHYLDAVDRLLAATRSQPTS